MRPSIPHHVDCATESSATHLDSPMKALHSVAVEAGWRAFDYVFSSTFGDVEFPVIKNLKLHETILTSCSDAVPSILETIHAADFVAIEGGDGRRPARTKTHLNWNSCKQTAGAGSRFVRSLGSGGLTRRCLLLHIGALLQRLLVSG